MAGMNIADVVTTHWDNIDPTQEGVTRVKNLQIIGNAQVEDDRTIAFGSSGTADAYIKYSSSANTLIFFDRTYNATRTLSQLAAAGTGVTTLDEAFDGGKTIDGATSTANAFVVGGATDSFKFWQEAANDIRIGTTAGANVTLSCEGGTFSFSDDAISTTGKVTADGGLEIGADSTKLTFGASDATDSYIQFNGTSLQFFDSDLNAIVTLKTLANNAMTDPTVSGNLVVTEGKVTWTDAVDEVAGAWTFSNVANDAIDIVANSATTGALLSVASTSLTSGSVFKATTTEATLNGGFYFQAYDATAAGNVFTVGEDGVTTITGGAAANMLVVTAGDVQVDNGKIEVDTTQDITTYVYRNNATGTNAVMEVKERNATGGTTLLVNSDATDGNDALQVTHDGTGYGLSVIGTAATGKQALFRGPASQTASIVVVDGTTGSWLGANGVGMIHASSDGALAHAGASLLYSTYTGNTAAVVPSGACGYFYENGTVAAGGYAVGILAVTAHGLNVGSSAAATTSLNVTGGAAAGETSSMVVLDGTAGSGFIGAAGVGQLHIKNNKALANATSSLAYVTYTGNAAGANLSGACAYFVEAGNASGTSYAVGIISTNNNGLKIVTSATGKTALIAQCVASTTVAVANFDGGTNGWVGAATTGLVTISNSGAPAADASLLRITSSGQPAAANDGVCIELVDTGAAQATSYAMRISSANNEALHVDDGVVLVDETLTATGGIITLYNQAVDLTATPTGAELDGIMGVNSTAGKIAVVKDSGGTPVYLVVSDGADNWYVALTKAV
jgi:hypothetical protein